jgi:FtsP/CotA-like multicopper oxidase with cupredoxin domain
LSTLPRTLQFDIRAAVTDQELIPGHLTEVWAYNGSVPGPKLHANVGDTLVVRFFNDLPEPSTIHWHGLELPAGMDGSHISQPLVPPGESYVYHFKVLRAATYWYHSHVKTDEQVEKGLYGSLVVHDPEERQRFDLPQDEYTLILDDVLLDDEFQIKEHLPQDPLERAGYLANGRLGNHLLVNGKRQPTIELAKGKPIRMRLINAANSRFFRLSFPGIKVTRIGGDLGLLTKSQTVQTIQVVENTFTGRGTASDADPDAGVLLVPGDRQELILFPEDSGQFLVEWHATVRGSHQAQFTAQGLMDLVPDPFDGLESHQTVFTLNVIDSLGGRTNYVPPAELLPTDALSLEKAQEKPKLTVTFGHSLPDGAGNVMFFAKTLMKDGKMMPVSFMKLTNEMALQGKVGETRMLEVVNLTRGIHPFHIHGFAFQALETVFMDMEYPERNRRVVYGDQKEWMDTIPILPRPGFRMKSRSITRLLIRFDDEGRNGKIVAHGGPKAAHAEHSGGWFVHCHIMEHARYGMSTWLNITD